MSKSADKGLVVEVWKREDHIREAEKQLDDEEICEEVSNDAAPLLKTINAVIAKIRKQDDLKRDNLLFYYERSEIRKVLSPTLNS